jgi:L-asparaginase/Glu-tRNA(Gln) amidotransferase subunit D
VATPGKARAGTKIVVLGTGGTIAGVARKAGDNVGYDAAQLGVAQLLQGLPGVDARGVVAEQVAQVNCSWPRAARTGWHAPKSKGW